MSLDLYLYCDVDGGGPDGVERHEFFSWNVTHNLGKMANAAGIYQPLWHPEENGIETAQQLIEPLRIGIAKLIRAPQRYKKFEPPLVDGKRYGSYDNFIPHLQELLEACERYPKAKVYASI